jgi:hypothetical protein
MSQSSKEISVDSLHGLAGIGGRLAFLQAFSVVFAIASYFIWPNVFEDHTVQMILEGILRQPFAYFMKLEPLVLIASLLQIPVYLGLWSVLRKTAPSKALIALIVGMTSIIAIFTARPILEMFTLASKYGATDIATEKTTYLSAGEALLTQFNGTAWALSTILGGVASILFGLIMRKSTAFRTSTTWAMLIAGAGAVIVLVPVIGILSLFLLATIGGVLASILYGIDLLRYDKAGI